MDILKVKIDPRKGVTVRYDAAPGANEDGSVPAVQHVTVECEDAPHPDLLGALSALREVVEDVCLLPHGYCAVMDVRGVTLSHNADGDVQATVTGLRPVAGDRLFALTTPLFEPSGAQHRLVLAVQREARRYVRGKRAQLALAFDAARSGDSLPDGIDAVSVHAPDGDGVMHEVFRAERRPHGAKTAGRA